MSDKRIVTERVCHADYPQHDYLRHIVEVRCCGQWLRVTGRFTTTCDHCGTDYNSSGQRLAPRADWGEETGEHWSECY